ncbi:MAG: hypothetical protein KME01_13730 [Chroococcus sp. CMT-3BRIN-NPC107]|jgi:hypothetical protein|nr:hypothetical protein [Chroococcus sp. CMT-3BRIN-NPC107]
MASKEDSKQDTATDNQNLDSLLELLQGDLSSLDPAAGLETVDEWYNTLHKSKDKGTTVVDNFRKLTPQL